MNKQDIAEYAYTNGYQKGVADTKKSLQEAIEYMLSSNDVDIIISEDEVFVPISTLREVIRKLEEK
jgi:hypothetical protein